MIVVHPLHFLAKVGQAVKIKWRKKMKYHQGWWAEKSKSEDSSRQRMLPRSSHKDAVLQCESNATLWRIALARPSMTI